LDWDADTAWVSIGFDDSGGVVQKRYYPLKRATWPQRVRRVWERWFP
jgi:hypothetical protein